MNTSTKSEVKRLGEYAHFAINKHLKKTLKWESQVKQDKDPEALHQMRVGMRRLRTAVSRFDGVIQLPKSASDRNIGKVSRNLGSLRDIDVLKETLEQKYVPSLPSEEQKYLQLALEVLKKQRKKAVVEVQQTLKGKRYKSLVKSMKKWLEKPEYYPLAYLTLENVLPDLLLPEVSIFMLHPGWLVATQREADRIVVPTGWDKNQIEASLASQGKIMHDLRKQAKRLRYQMELFTDRYRESYQEHISEVKNIQEVLGSIQDSMVLETWLLDIFNSTLREKIPTASQLFIDNRFQLWEQWQSIQVKYLTPEIRYRFHLTILNPETSQISV